MSNKSIQDLKMKIESCKSCDLYKNQNPCIDHSFSFDSCDVLWMGISEKIHKNQNEIPIDPSTKTGEIISLIEGGFEGVRFYRSNLVKCPPLKESKIRYPKKTEIRACWKNVSSEIKALSPKCIILLGAMVADFFEKNYKLNLIKPSLSEGINSIFCPEIKAHILWVHHPSYIQVYKKSEILNYSNQIKNKIDELCMKK